MEQEEKDEEDRGREVKETGEGERNIKEEAEGRTMERVGKG